MSVSAVEGRPMRKEMDPNSLLILWTKFHGRVAPKFHTDFRNRPEIQELVYYRREVLEQAFSRSPKLTEIIARARELDPEIQRKLNSPKPPPPQPREEVLPLPGDPGATRRPGQKQEHYRTGEEAELRHIARKHKWWE